MRECRAAMAVVFNGEESRFTSSRHQSLLAKRWAWHAGTTRSLKRQPRSLLHLTLASPPSFSHHQRLLRCKAPIDRSLLFIYHRLGPAISLPLWSAVRFPTPPLHGASTTGPVLQRTSLDDMSRTQQDQFIDDDEEETCPLCVEEFDLTDKGFRPCPCGYQVNQLTLTFGSERPLIRSPTRSASSVTTMSRPT